MVDIGELIYNSEIIEDKKVTLSRNCGISKAVGLVFIKIINGEKEVEVTSCNVEDLEKIKQVILFAKKLKTISISNIQTNSNNYPSFLLTVKKVK